MILIDALYINNGGGKILLDYLISKIEERKIQAVFLLDERIRGNNNTLPHNQVIYLNSSFFERNRFYAKNISTFSCVLCFGNLPPNIKLNSLVFTYFHNPMYLSVPHEFNFTSKIKFKLKVIVLRSIIKNTNYWLVQSDSIKNEFIRKFQVNAESIKVIPFYSPFKNLHEHIIREKNTYLYVSNATPQKNHSRLIQAFCLFYDEYKLGKLILTVNNDYPHIIDIINTHVKMGYPIHNIGFVDRYQLQKTYLSTEYLIFPSLAESFGLGLIEAIECGCKVIGADLQYTYEVCEPSLRFNPLDVQSIVDAFKGTVENPNISPSIPRIKNTINELLNLLIA